MLTACIILALVAEPLNVVLCLVGVAGVVLGPVLVAIQNREGLR